MNESVEWDCENCKYKAYARIGAEDVEGCTYEGVFIFLDNIVECPKLRKEEQAAVEKIEVPVSVYEAIEKAEESLEVIRKSVEKLSPLLDEEDLVALIYGRRSGIGKTAVRQVLKAIKQASHADTRYALIKFIASIGNVRIGDVKTVLEELERISKRYVEKGDSSYA